MITLVKNISTRIIDGIRYVKFLRFGRSDVQEVQQTAPFGIDANPIAKMLAVYAKTATTGKPVIIGYINANQQAAEGEVRLYSLNAQGVEQIYLHLLNNGTIQLGGTADNVVRYNPLDTALDGAVNQINANFTSIATAINAIVPGSYTPVPVTLDITAAKVTEVKVS